ncbi:MAG: antibiotic biosynthesis monooxygenase family protein [Desulfovermiculus sp.]
MVKAFIKRRVPSDKAREMIPLFRKMRTLAMQQHGYISGETLRNMDQEDEYLVVSAWNSAKDWQRWLESKERQEVQKEIDQLLGGKTEYSLYHTGFSE